MSHKFDIIFLPLYRDIGDVIVSEIYWTLNTLEFTAENYRTQTYVGRISQTGLEHIGKLSDNVSSYNIDSNRTVTSDFLFYISILRSGLKNIFSAKIWHHYGSFGYMKGFNPAFLLPKFGKKYVLGPILYPTNDPPDTAVRLGFIRKQHAYGKLAVLIFRVLHILTLLRSDVIIFDSYTTKNIYTSQFPFIKKKVGKIIPGGGISQKDFYMDITTTKHENIILGVASNLIKRKNIDKLIEAVASSELNISLKIAGDGPERENLMSMVEKFGLNGKVIFIGRIDHSAMRHFYNSIDIYVALDNVPSEAKISLQEAMMCGCAVISGETDVKNFVVKKEWGLVVNPVSISDIGRAINLICNNPQDLLKIKINAKRYADELFSTNTILKRYQDIFNDLISDSGRFA